MKINAKLGGTNVRLAGSQQDAMPHIGRKAAMFIGKRVQLSRTGIAIAPLLKRHRGDHLVKLLCWCNAGADVTHPVGFSETEPSIASVVASLVRLSC
jgi:hypothetical protein